MRNFDADSLPLPANFSKRTPEETAGILFTSGNRSFFRLQEGDIITLSDEIVTRTKMVTNHGKRSFVQVPYICVKVNGEPRFLPFSALRDKPYFDSMEEYNKFYAGYNFMRELAECNNDYERYNLLKGVNTLKVAATVKAKARNWTVSPVGTDPDKVTYLVRNFAMLVKAE